jgi:hypothetical protein
MPLCVFCYEPISARQPCAEAWLGVANRAQLQIFASSVDCAECGIASPVGAICT